jgi:hypothetical protein
MGIAEAGSIFLWLPRRCNLRSSRPLSFSVELADVGVTRSPVSSSLAFQRRNNPNGGIFGEKGTDRSYELETESRNKCRTKGKCLCPAGTGGFYILPLFSFFLLRLFARQELPDPVAIPFRTSATGFLCHGPFVRLP